MEEEGSDEKLSNLQQFVKETLTKKTGNPTPSLGFTFVPRVINLSHFPPTLITVLVCLTAARDEFLSWKKAKNTSTQPAHFLFLLGLPTGWSEDFLGSFFGLPLLCHFIHSVNKLLSGWPVTQCAACLFLV